jgi:hypothetical protein
VDKDDLEILMNYWGQGVNDPTLLAHWALDEVEGRVAADSVGTSDGTLVGNSLWQPAGRLASTPLASGTIMTDGNWHRIGFTWDGANRSLYVDDVLVAGNTQNVYENLYTTHGLSRRSIKWIMAK